ncbi:MAG: helix-turn-helix domain-containing protein [Actinomycetota bacterium]|nr:helix-turn-helix domain-containing protein [Actinomycetota bacterium]
MPPRKEKKQPTRPPIELHDAQSIKALAHPARLAVIDELFAGRELTATECAEIAGLSPSAMSYHLRALEKVGIVERAEASGDGRERPWRAAGSKLMVTSEESIVAFAAGAVVGKTVADRLTAGFARWIERTPSEDPAWRDVGGISSALVWLTHDDAADVEKTITDLIDKYRGRTAGAHPDGARRVRVGLLLYPNDET